MSAVTHLRAQGARGLTKDWIVEVGPAGLRIRYGRTGVRLRETVVPAAKCRPTPEAEADRRIAEQLADGYWRVSPPSTPPSAPPPPPRPRRPAPAAPAAGAPTPPTASVDLSDWFRGEPNGF